METDQDTSHLLHRNRLENDLLKTHAGPLPQVAKLLNKLAAPPSVVFSARPVVGVRKPIKSQRRLEALLINPYRKEQSQRRLLRLERQKQNQQIIPVIKGGKGRPVGKIHHLGIYPVCPKCAADTSVIRAGFAKGEQRYRCRTCKRTFYSDSVLQLVEADIQVVCHRCGTLGRTIGYSARPASGLVGFCPNCKRRFTQGGRHHLDNTLILLIQRIREARYTDDLRDEIYANASLKVLVGHAYTWNVPLDHTLAYETLGITWGKGSAHPEYLHQQGQKTDRQS
jgi:uncharacterized CHY-type Zn-finger protein